MSSLPKKVLKIAHETIDVSLAGRLVDDVLVVVIAQAARQLLVVHFGLVLAYAPPARHLVRVGELELPAVARPRDEALARLVREQLEQELPQLDGARAGEARPAARRPALERGQHRRLDDGLRLRRAHRRTVTAQPVQVPAEHGIGAASLLAHRPVAAHVRTGVVLQEERRRLLN